jgi:hypothetical protein
MDPRFQTSFIPKKPLISNSKPVSRTINLFGLIATLVFIATVGLAVSVFFYDRLIVNQIIESKATLERAKGAFEPELINKIVRLDTKIGVAKGLLSDHLSASHFFDIVSKITLKTVRFKSYSFGFLAKDKIVLSMKGQAQSFTAVALQSDALNAEKSLKDTVISDLSLDAIGTISFTVVANIDPAVVLSQEIIKASDRSQSTTN